MNNPPTPTFTPIYTATVTATITKTPTGTPPTSTATATPLPADWQSRDYKYDPEHPHAVASVTSETVNSYQYDANGNMTCRVEGGVAYKQMDNCQVGIVSVDLVVLRVINCLLPLLVNSPLRLQQQARLK